MSETAPLDPIEQNALLEQITLVLVHNLPSAYQECTVVHRALGSHHETLGQVRRLSGPGLPGLFDVHPALVELFGRLRDGMYKPGTGTWFTATFQLGFPFSYQISYDYEGEPAWRTPPGPAAYAEEAGAFPRAAEHTPDWLADHSAQS